jgi:hypothetical protein
MIINPADGSWAAAPGVVSTIVSAVLPLRESSDPFDVVITGRTPAESPDEAADLTGSIGAAGATWWLEGARPGPGERELITRRIEAGPPR